MSRVATVVICDDHALFREGIKAVLRGEPSVEVVGEAENGREAVDKALSLRPSVVLMDVEMPELNGFEATRRIKQTEGSIKVLILTMYEEEAVVARCLEAGASGYVLKDASPSQLVEAIGAVHSGSRYLSPRALNKVVDQYLTSSPRAKTKYDSLSDREREVLKLLADGLTIKEIASNLKLSTKTVDVHKYNLMRKLDIHDRAELIKFAIRENLIRLPVMSTPVLDPDSK